MIAFIADIHGNLPALEAVLAELERYEISTIYSLGDVAGYYPFINECIELLINRDIKHILGNHDNYLVNNIDCSRSFRVNQAISFQRSIITSNNLNWLKAAPSFFSEDYFFAVHGGISDYLEEYSYTPYFSQTEQSLFLCGHTHIQQYIKEGTKHFCNPGSVGQPRDKDCRAAFALLDSNGQITLKRVDYDISAIVDAIIESGFDESFYRGLYTGEVIASEGSSLC